MYTITLIDPGRVRFRLDADNARVTEYHITFYKVEDDAEVLVASFFLSDVEEVIDLSKLEPFPPETEEEASDA